MSNLVLITRRIYKVKSPVRKSVMTCLMEQTRVSYLDCLTGEGRHLFLSICGQMKDCSLNAYCKDDQTRQRADNRPEVTVDYSSGTFMHPAEEVELYFLD